MNWAQITEGVPVFCGPRRNQSSSVLADALSREVEVDIPAADTRGAADDACPCLIPVVVEGADVLRVAAGGGSNKGTVLYDAVFLGSDEVLKPLSWPQSDYSDHGWRGSRQPHYVV